MRKAGMIPTNPAASGMVAAATATACIITFSATVSGAVLGQTRCSTFQLPKPSKAA
jgi:hypothetical protein